MLTQLQRRHFRPPKPQGAPVCRHLPSLENHKQSIKLAPNITSNTRLQSIVVVQTSDRVVDPGGPATPKSLPHAGAHRGPRRPCSEPRPPETPQPFRNSHPFHQNQPKECGKMRRKRRKRRVEIGHLGHRCQLTPAMLRRPRPDLCFESLFVPYAPAVGYVALIIG